MKEQLTLNMLSVRARKAKVAYRLDNKAVRYALGLASITCVFGWAWLVFVEHIMAGHLLLGVSSCMTVPLAWYKGELSRLTPDASVKDVSDISQVLNRRLLTHIKANTTPKQLAQAIAKQPGGHFFAARFAIGPEFFNMLAADDEGSTALVWSAALDIASDYNLKEIDSGVLAAALILSIPAIEQHLTVLQLDKDDILAGVRWYLHVQALIERHQQRRQYGGIGRDLSFGWAPLLNHVGLNLTDTIQNGGILRRAVTSRNDVIDQTLRLLGQSGRRNAVLVGGTGVGKTTLVHSLAQKLLLEPQKVPHGMGYQQVISLDAATLLANVKSRGQLEALLMRIFREAIHAKNVILFLDDAQLFLRDGTGSVDLTNLLLPVLEGGAVKVILSLNDQEWLRLSRANPGLSQLMNRVIVKPLDEDETMQVVEDEIIFMETKNKMVYMYQTLKQAFRLADRFVHDQEFPGKAIRLLELAATFPEQGHFITVKSVQQAVERSYGVQVQVASSRDERDTLLNLEQKIHERMINQSRAVKLLSDALRRARSGVRNENKPIGTFLFLGPTGVGKTELSKALADVYFGGENKLVRVDLNEYSRAYDTGRLLAVGADDPHSLCAQIAKQPFSVVLLDEIEKAHPNVLNILLQLLDEGTLRDAGNKPVSFKDAIIIATSNAGAEQIRGRIEQGQQLEQFEDELVDELINANVFRPEFINRFDEIIMFRPLTVEELTKVVDLLMVRLNNTLAERKISVTLTQRAKEFLATRGYDPRLGARPLRRVVQRAVENVVAQRLLAQEITPGQALQLDAPELQQALDER